MSRESIKKRRRASKAARQRQKLMITGGLAILLIVIIIIAVFVLGSCGTDYAETDTNTVYVLKDGKIVSTDIEAFDENTYDKDELNDYMKDIIDTYNNENGKDSIKQKSFEVKDDVATLVLEYAAADVYEDFNGIEVFTGSIAEAKEAGYSFTGTFANLADGKAYEATVDDFSNDTEYKVVIIKANTKVVVDGDICYISTQNVAEFGEDWVLIKDGAELAITEMSTEAVGTETEGSDGAISDEELLLGEEEEIIFDFGEESSEGSQYSEVYTYIIYK